MKLASLLGHFEVDRGIFYEQLLDYLFRQIRIIPHYQRGKPAGFKIIGIRSNSIFRSMGFKNGDVIKSIAGDELTSINKAFKLFEKLRLLDLLSLEVIFERATRLITHHYEFAHSKDCRLNPRKFIRQLARHRARQRARQSTEESTE